MSDKSKMNIANGVISGLVVACGISFGVLVYILFNNYTTSGVSTIDAYASSKIWGIGSAFIVPGVIGIIASGVQAKGGYITQMVFCIFALVIMVIIIIICLVAIVSLASYCNGGIRICEILKELSAIVAVAILGWIFTLVATILGGILSCRRERVHPGFVMQSATNPTVVHTSTMGHMAP